MPVLRVRTRDGSPELYRKIVEAIDLEHDHPLGLIMHGAARVEGRMQIAQVWESEEYARKFDEERLLPALKKAGAPLDAEVTVVELHHLVTP
jgi:hypothetical protein